MSLDRPQRGVFVPALTPFTPDLAVDEARFVEHCKWLLAEGANGLAVFGTTSEANSLSHDERRHLLDRVIGSGIAPRALMPGTGCCAIPDTVALTRHAVERGVLGVLLLPPFYYKNVSDDGIYASVAEVVHRVGDARLRIYLYHIPPMASVGFSLPLIERLLRDFPDTIVGLKDSSGDWKNTEALLNAFPGMEIFPGSETFLLAGLRSGAVGCISATANVNAAGIAELLRCWREPGADAKQAELTAIRAAIQKFPVIAAAKAMLAAASGDADWKVVRPPLQPLSAEAAAELARTLESLDFAVAPTRVHA